MSYALKVQITDLATPSLRALVKAQQPANLLPIVGRAARNTTVKYLRSLDAQRPNAIGGTRTHFYLNAARGTQFQVVPDGVVISINQVGIAQRYYGGTITPKTSKYLTIPVAPEAYGKRASELRDLEIIFGLNRLPIALATKPGSGSIKGGKDQRFGVVLFLLLKSVTQAPDPTVLPTEEEIGAGIRPRVIRYLQRAIDRNGGNS